MKSEEKVPGFKVRKERLIILFVTNASGTMQMKPFIIHHSARSQALKTVLLPKFSVIWRSNMKAWMTSETFDVWYLSYAILLIENSNRKCNLSNKAHSGRQCIQPLQAIVHHE